MWGLFWLGLATLGAGYYFFDGMDALATAWQLPEYSHGPLIPILSALLFLRQLKEYPVEPGPKNDRWAGVLVVFVALVVATLGNLANISDIVAYALILWVGGILLVSFGWNTGKHFWPPVVHLVYMLPLPGVIYYKMTTWLQFISSELGVWFLRLLSVPVFLEGNIIDLGVYKLHVAEACSGLRYLFPIMSFSYIFAVLYKGPMWHKAVLLISAAPITVLMNSVRIAFAGVLVQELGLEWLEGFTHFFEGWVIFLICILLLFALARILLFFQPTPMSLTAALDLNTDGLLTQASRLKFVYPSKAMITVAVLMIAASAAWQSVPERGVDPIERESFATFPRQFGKWQQDGLPLPLEKSIEVALGADDYHSINLVSSEAAAPVGFFSAWYEDQSDGGVHSPEICLPSGGWEIAWLERSDLTDVFGSDKPFEVNRAIIQKNERRMMVFYWFEQRGKRIAWDMEAKFWLMMDGITTGRTDGALVRLTTHILPNESDEDAEARLMDVMREILKPLPRFVPN
ncbi:VPLPA-CTERM-specific exosortase XrtD [Sedimentitalea sp. XS_ASV28]|uniref:VPLPA-CTERM-specific exosortase XrtD n=1 Tax=Sedimentitalea sp. XS_ASV28 TaxID=3241296 RepID=UPI0035170540